jgi:type I restriction enzyme S subunit
MITKTSIQGKYPIKTLAEVADFLDNLRRPITASNRESGPYPYYGANGQQDSVADYIFDEPLILIAEDGGLFDQPDRGIAYAIEGKTWVNNHAHVLRPKKCVDIRFLLRVLENYDVTPWITGSTRAKLTKGAAANIEIPLPPLAEQKRIAAILDKADGIRRKLQQSLRLSDDFLRSVFLDMFGDPVTNPKGWPLQTLTGVIGDSFRNGLSPSTSGTVAGKVLTLSAVTSGTFAPQFLRDAIFDRTPSENQQVTRNTFLICRGNGNKSMVGIGVFPEADMPSVSFPDTMIACTIDRTQIEPEYLQAVWSTAKVRKQIDAGARTTNGTYKVNQTLLGSIEFPLPTLEIQKKFSDTTQATRSQSAKTAELTAESENLFSSLQQRAFRGEL